MKISRKAEKIKRKIQLTIILNLKNKPEESPQSAKWRRRSYLHRYTVRHATFRWRRFIVQERWVKNIYKKHPHQWYAEETRRESAQGFLQNMQVEHAEYTLYAIPCTWFKQICMDWQTHLVDCGETVRDSSGWKAIFGCMTCLLSDQWSNSTALCTSEIVERAK